MEIEIIGDRSLDHAGDLLRWLREERIPGLDPQQKQGPNVAGTQGAELVAILTAVLSSGAVVALAQSLHVWIKAKQPQIRLKVTIPRKGTFEIDAKNAHDEASLIAQFRTLIDG